ncbi:MAG: RimK family alpha-L-glutamate ligase [Thermodesulfobacteriota bacterium]
MGTALNRMRIGILTVKNHRYHPNRRLIETARRLNHEPILIHPGKLCLSAGRDGLRTVWLCRESRPDVLLPRIGATIKEYGLTAIRHFELQGIPLVNRYEAILLARNKFLTAQCLCGKGLPVPETLYASNWANFGEAVSRLGGFPVVVKISRGRQGSGVLLVGSTHSSRDLLREHLQRDRGVLIQRYIPPEGRRDFRLLVVGTEVVGAMELKPVKGDFRSNIHLGGKATKLGVGGKMFSLALRSSRAIGLDIAGVDVIQDQYGNPWVMEVNYSPGFKGLEVCTGIDVAQSIIRLAVKRAKEA